MATFGNCETFSTYYFSYVRGYEAALRGGNISSRKNSDLNFSGTLVSLLIKLSLMSRKYRYQCLFLNIVMKSG